MTDERRLEELVNDERARRTYAEKELAAQKAQAQEWKRRARRAEKAARFSLRLPERRPSPPSKPEVGQPKPRFPVIRVGVHEAPAWLSRAFDTVPLAGIAEADLAGLDLVAVGGTRLPTPLRDWMRWPVRQPLLGFPSNRGPDDAGGDFLFDVSVGEGGPPGRLRVDLPEVMDPGDPGGPIAAPEARQRLRLGRSGDVGAAATRLLQAVGIDPPRSRWGVTAVVMTKRPHRVSAVAETLARMDTPEVQVVLGTHGFEAAASDRSLVEQRFGDRARFRVFAEEAPLGKCLNQLVAETTTEAWAKIDDDDHYGSLYLEEALLELERTGADLVGKLTHHLYDSRLNRTYLMEGGNEYRSTRYVPGPTFVGRRHTWEEVRFPHRGARVDSIFVRGMNAIGMSIYSTSRFEFAFGRGDDDHTWHVDESLYEAKGKLVAEGFAADEIFLEPPGASG